ncbi:MAG: hypothetical protein M9944_06680 [Rhizobiaceae bacterium]|nr:hypothetical protein [Rhizobiaceae bacterium]
MRIVAITVMIASLAASVSAVSAQEERYRLERTDNGYVRLDTQTGDMSICEERTGQLVCRAAAEERAAFHNEIDRLNDAIATLEKRVSALEKSPASSGLPSEEEFDRTMSYMERFFRGFMDIVRDNEKDVPSDRT